MQSLAILTDSYAHLPMLTRKTGAEAGLLPLRIVPNTITLGGRTYLEDAAFSAEQAPRLLQQTTHVPRVSPPSVSDYVTAFTQAAREARCILSLHASRELSASWQNAREAAAQLLGRAQIVLLDTRTIGPAQSLLVQMALTARSEQDSFDAVLHQVRRAIDHTYSIYYVENVETLAQNQLIASSHAVLGAMLAIKPILTIEQGRLIPMEKVKSRAQAIERLVEFAVEFTQIETLFMLHYRAHATETAQMLQERLAQALPGIAFTSGMYGASLAGLIGNDAIGLALMEHERASELEGDETDDDADF